jgi:hypothetical protein
LQLKVWRRNGRGERLFKPPKHRSDTGSKFACPKRLGNVVVSAKVQAADAVFFTGFSGKKDDWNPGQVAAFANLAANFIPTATGDHDIEQKEDRRLLPRQRQNLVTGSANAYIEPSQLQVMADQVADVRVIFENDDVLLH